ncbi:MAG: plasmid mobilization relaxosome protein MobC [Pseudomonadota bacterium]
MKVSNPKGGRPPKDGEKRDEFITLRVTPSEKHAIEEHARACGLRASDYARSLALGFKPSASEAMHTDPAVVSLLNTIVLQTKRIGNNVNQLARSTHRGSAFQQFWAEIGDELRIQVADAQRALREAVR